MEDVSTYYDQFILIYTNVRPLMWKIYFWILGIIAAYGVLRITFKYATFTDIGEWEDSSFLVYAMERLYMRFMADEEEVHDWNRTPEKKFTAAGGHLGGTLTDLLGAAFLGLLIIWAYPIIIPVAIIFMPVQLCRWRFKKKKMFVANLRGEQLGD